MIKKQSEVLFAELGMNLTTAINVFLRQAVRDGGFPFEARLDVPNKRAVAAIEEALALIADKNIKSIPLKRRCRN